MTIASAADNIWTQALAGLHEQDLFLAMNTSKEIWEPVLFPSSISKHAEMQPLRSEAMELDTLEAWANQTYPSVFPQHAEAFSNWTLQVFQAFESKYALANTNRKLLLGLRAAYVLGHTLNGTLRLALNERSVQSPNELRKASGLILPKHIVQQAELFSRQTRKRAPHSSQKTAQRLPLTFDLRKYGAIAGVKNQGNCASCYAFAATVVMEGRLAMQNRSSVVPLSEQQVVSCGNIGACKGGWMGQVWKYAQAGLATGASYAYVNANSNVAAHCRNDTSKFWAKTTSASVTFARTNRELKLAVLQGPVAIGVDGSNACFTSYRSGLLKCDCPSTAQDVDHAVAIVGWGRNYWIVRNSWGEGWGERGYAKFPFKPFPGTCGMFHYAIYPTGQVQRY